MVNINLDRIKKPKGIIALVAFAATTTGCALLWSSERSKTENFSISILFAIALFNFIGYMLKQPGLHTAAVGALTSVATQWVITTKSVVDGGTETDAQKRLVAGTVLALSGAFVSFCSYPMKFTANDSKKHIGIAAFILMVELAGSIILAVKKEPTPTTEALIVGAIFFVATMTRSIVASAAVLFAAGFRLTLDLTIALERSEDEYIAASALLWSSWVLMIGYIVYRLQQYEGIKKGYIQY